MQVYKNPYDLPRDELVEMITELQHREKFKILRRFRDRKNKKIEAHEGHELMRKKREIQ